MTFQLKSEGMAALAAEARSAGPQARTTEPMSRPAGGLNTKVKTMTLKEKLQADVTAHMKAGRKLELVTVRNVLGEIGTREKSGKTPVELDDAQVTALMQKEAAKRRDTARIYTEAGEDTRAAAEIAEAVIIEAYLPKPLERADVEKIVASVISALEGDGTKVNMRSMGAVMKVVTAKVAGRFDGKAVSDIVRAALA